MAARLRRSVSGCRRWGIRTQASPSETVHGSPPAVRLRRGCRQHEVESAVGWNPLDVSPFSLTDPVRHQAQLNVMENVVPVQRVGPGVAEVSGSGRRTNIDRRGAECAGGSRWPTEAHQGGGHAPAVGVGEEAGRIAAPRSCWPRVVDRERPLDEFPGSNEALHWPDPMPVRSASEGFFALSASW